MWGLLPIYWHLLGHIPPFELLCHRIVWSTVVVALVVPLTGRVAAFKALVVNRRILARLLITALLISANWFLFIWAVSQQRVLDSSLGYFITPLMNSLLGYLVFKERFTRLQGIGIGFAAAGVLWSLLSYGSLPFLALAMALTFALYGMVRKLTPADPLCALFVETLLVTPIALAFLCFSYSHGQPMPELPYSFLLVLAGPLTFIPLLFFGYAAQRIRLTVIGLAQYLSPTLSFLVSIFVLNEAFNVRTLITFVFIWIGLALFTWSTWRLAHPPHRRT
jgi:rarD protein